MYVEKSGIQCGVHFYAILTLFIKFECLFYLKHGAAPCIHIDRSSKFSLIVLMKRSLCETTSEEMIIYDCNLCCIYSLEWFKKKTILTSSHNIRLYKEI